MLIELSMLVAAGLACSTLAMPWARVETPAPSPVRAVASDAGEAEKTRISGEALGSLLADACFADEAVILSEWPRVASVLPAVREQGAVAQVVPYLLVSSVAAQTYH